MTTGNTKIHSTYSQLAQKLSLAVNRHGRHINIMGVRGVPAAHGGFETFAARLAPYLRDHGWTVSVYCQLDPDANGNVAPDFEDYWQGIHRIHLGTNRSGSVGSMIFDWRCIVDVQRRAGVDLVLGYNTAIFTILSRMRGRKVLMNMDGIEWQRGKWPLPVKAWFYLNEFIGANTASVPIADHPEIAKHLERHFCRRSVVIPYGADAIDSAPADYLARFALEPDRYLVSIARLEPENSILEIVQAFSARPRGVKLAVLGKLAEDNPYHRAVRAAASQEVTFLGAIYDQNVVASLRFHCLAYLHGHQVGGTNPSLVEALGAGNAVIAHDNRFNRWVAGPEQRYFSNIYELDQIISATEGQGRAWLVAARNASRSRHVGLFRWDLILQEYERRLESFVGKSSKKYGS